MKDYNPKNQLKPLWRTPQQRKAVKNKETIAEEPCCPNRPFCGNVVVYNPIGSYECHRVKVNERKNIEYVHGFLCFVAFTMNRMKQRLLPFGRRQKYKRKSELPNKTRIFFLQSFCKKTK
jgi:hypothetical protein